MVGVRKLEAERRWDESRNDRDMRRKKTDTMEMQVLTDSKFFHGFVRLFRTQEWKEPTVIDRTAVVCIGSLGRSEPRNYVSNKLGTVGTFMRHKDRT